MCINLVVKAIFMATGKSCNRTRPACVVEEWTDTQKKHMCSIPPPPGPVEQTVYHDVFARQTDLDTQKKYNTTHKCH